MSEVQPVQPQPVPMTWAIGPVEGANVPLLGISIRHPVGETVFFMTPGDARAFAMALIEHAKTAAGKKLATPPSGLIVPETIVKMNGDEPS